MATEENAALPFNPSFSVIKENHPVDALHFAFIGEDLLLVEDSTDNAGANQLPLDQHVRALGAAESDCLIGTIGDTPCRARFWPAGTALPRQLQATSLRNVFGILREQLFPVAVRAKQLVGWDRQSRYCGACGTATEPITGEPAKTCPACELRTYPRLSPAVMVLIQRDKELLLARSPHFRVGVYSALAGFVEAGESVEDCIHREVFEEVGLKVKNLRWFGSQSWPFPHSLMLAFHADYASGDIVPQAAEIEDARWFTLDALPQLPSPVSVAYDLITAAIKALRA